MKLSKLGLVSALCATGLLGSGLAAAATATTNLSVTASIAANCTISTTPIAFGAYDPVVANLTTDKDGTGTVTVACTKGASGLEIGMGNGSYYSGGTRRVFDGTADYLNYSIYKPSTNTPGDPCAYTTAWGTGVAPSANNLALTNAPSKAGRTYNVCGRMPQGQDAAVGSYTDTVVATIYF
jgi:spore coat protein U-like protein